MCLMLGELRRLAVCPRNVCLKDGRFKQITTRYSSSVPQTIGPGWRGGGVGVWCSGVAAQGRKVLNHF